MIALNLQERRENARREKSKDITIGENRIKHTRR
jgi:hypothetical protein